TSRTTPGALDRTATWFRSPSRCSVSPTVTLSGPGCMATLVSVTVADSGLSLDQPPDAASTTTPTNPVRSTSATTYPARTWLWTWMVWRLPPPRMRPQPVGIASRSKRDAAEASVDGIRFMDRPRDGGGLA